MKQTEKEWRDWLLQMEQILALELDESRRAELLAQFRRIADMAEPLMAYPFDQRLEIAGVYKA
ncbi:TPA: oxalurate catabolism protein HpxX [Klebsiella aerogenes]|nr:oxalurate catabolism protein HpxX [Klebsiella aerogenes]